MPLLERRADRFERAITGPVPTEHELQLLVGVTHRLTALAPGLPGPDARFVSDLGLRLREEMALLPRGVPVSGTLLGQGAKAMTETPRVLVLRRLPRVLAGVTAALLLVAAVVGVAARSALPGGTLYPVKGWLDSAAVQLAGSAYDRGLTHLGQAEEHISDARALAARRPPPPADIDMALTQSDTSVRQAQRDLMQSRRETHRASDLTPLSDFATRALPQLHALRSEVSAAAVPALGRLDALLQSLQDDPSRVPVSCAVPPCAPAVSPTTTPTTTTTTTSTSTTSTSTTSTATTSTGTATTSSSSAATGPRSSGPPGTNGIPAPTTSLLPGESLGTGPQTSGPTGEPTSGSAPAGSGPSRPGGSGGSSGSRPGSTTIGGGVTLPPKVTLPTLPSVTLTRVTPPSVTLPSVTLPSVTLPRVTLPRVTPPSVKLPRVTPPRVTPPSVKLPRVTPPRVTPPSVKLPRVTHPRVRVPAVTGPQVRVGSITRPRVRVPSLTRPPVAQPWLGVRGLQVSGIAPRTGRAGALPQRSPAPGAAVRPGLG